MVFLMIKLCILLLLIGILVSIFNGGKAVVHFLEWLTGKVREIFKV